MKKITIIIAGLLLICADASIVLACCGADDALAIMKHGVELVRVGALALVCLSALAFRPVRRSPGLIALHLGIALALGGWIGNELWGPRDGCLQLLPKQALQRRFPSMPAPLGWSSGRVAETNAPPAAGCVLAVDEFTIDRWEDTGAVRQYICKATVETTDAGGTTSARPVEISVNHPFVCDGWWVYQSSYQPFMDPHSYKPRVDPATQREVVDPYTGEPAVDPASGQPFIDPATGQPIYYTLLQCVKDVGLPYAALGGLLLVLGMCLYQVGFLRGKREETPAEPHSKRLRVLLALYALVFVGAAAMLVHRGLSTGHAPMQNMYEFLMCAAAFIPMCTLVSARGASEKAAVRTLLVDALLQTVVLMPVCFFMDGAVKRLMPALQSPFFVPHVGAYVIGYLLLIRAAFGVGIRAVATGYFLLTVGLVLGAVWGKVCWGHWWQFDPKEMWSLATWFVYAAYFHLQTRLPPWGRRAFLAAGAVMIVLTLTWINLSRIFTGIHSYAS